MTTPSDQLENTLSSNPASEPAPRATTAPRLMIGTRGSALALWQARWVRDRLAEAAPDGDFALTTIATQGDHTQPLDVPLAQLSDKGIFVAELEAALLRGNVDVAIHPMQDRALASAERELNATPISAAVHSLKDLPSTLTSGLTLAAITAREDPRDVLVSRSGARLAELPRGAVVATSSLRRRAQLLHLRPDLRIVSIRGNVDTRLRKTLALDGPDATILAAAGMLRLGLADHITEYLPIEALVPAVGQGALAVEVRAHDRMARRLARLLDDHPTHLAVLAERALLAALGGGCQVPLGAHAVPGADGRELTLLAVVASPDGQRLLRAQRTGPAARPATLGRTVARDLLNQGAGEILAEVLAR